MNSKIFFNFFNLDIELTNVQFNDKSITLKPGKIQDLLSQKTPIVLHEYIRLQ